MDYRSKFTNSMSIEREDAPNIASLVGAVDRGA